MKEKYFIFVKYKNDNRIVLQGTQENYSEAKKEAERLITLGHTASVFQLSDYLR